MAAETAPYQCLVCSAKFSKPAVPYVLPQPHLVSRLDSHDPDVNVRAFECTFCDISFNRRHWRTCEERLKSGRPPPVLPPRKRGRKQNACARCAQLKKKCNGSQPCENCSEHGQQCTYSRSVQAKSTPPSDKGDHAQSSPLPEWTTEQVTNFDQFMQTLLPEMEPFWPVMDKGVLGPLPSTTAAIPFKPITSSPNMPLLPFTTQGYSPSDPGVLEFAWDIAQLNTILPSLTPKPVLPPIKLRFLAKLTATHGMVNSFECPNPFTRRQIISTLTRGQKLLPSTGSTSPPVTTTWHEPVQFFNAQYFVPYTGDLNGWTYPGHSSQGDTLGSSALVQDGQVARLHPLASKSREIVRGICQKMQCRTTTANWSQSTERSCARFFSAPNLERFMESFWQFWYPNCPIIHKPTFLVSQRNPKFIASLVLVGACMAPDKSDRDQAMIWVEVVEDWVYSDPDFCEDPIPPTADGSHLSQIETRLDLLRAAYAVMVVLTWEGSERQMTRARRTRLTQIVCVARSLFFFAPPHSGRLISSGNNFADWKLFALIEECARTLLYVFVIDCAFVMFHNTPPRMVTSELRFSLACPEACFHASDPEMWLIRMDECQPPCQGMSLTEAISLIMRGDLDDKEWEVLEQMSTLNLFAITSSFHNLIFYHHHGPNHGLKSPPITRGLRNWVRAWGDRNVAPVDDESSQVEPFEGGEKIGFYRYTREYWGLAVILYNQPGYTRNRLVDLGTGTADSSDMGGLHDLIVRFQGVDLGEALVT
ncbi:Zinc finger C2H2 type domain containing [Fusarium albosuccineum]|uniref:Zinc finger C2H2 type domain containing n=1 Tax=Fusarium albosuccineum TaxID=1237068 RepID=A0A8H4LFB5_9HYPO|nr:Zinc finger C2H2 type domain containing [Fusarium albosuccineum]